MYHRQHDIQTRGIDATKDTSSQQREYPTFWKRYGDYFEIFLPNETKIEQRKAFLLLIGV